jgi:DNA-binding transcriptional LysR family regulator
MDTQNLKAFLTVARAKSFSAAAGILHITQPAVSKRISLLEQQLGSRLFDRIGRQISLTEAGRTLLPRAESILRDMAVAAQEVNDLQAQVKGNLKLITSHHIGLHRLPEVLKNYKSAFPQVEMNIQFSDSEDAYQSILAGEFDLGLVTASTDTDSRINSETIWQDNLVFVVADTHPLSLQESVTLVDISHYPALLPENKFLTTKIVEKLFQQNGLSITNLMSTNYLETIKALISVGYAWGVLPEIMLREGNLRELRIEGVQLVRQLDCINHKGRSISNPA